MGSQVQGGACLGLGVPDSEFLGLSLTSAPTLMTEGGPGGGGRSW